MLSAFSKCSSIIFGVLLLANVHIVSCVSTSRYNSIAHQNAVNLKIQVLHLVANADQDITRQVDNIEHIRSLADQAISFAESLPDNQDVTKLWLAAMGEQESMWADFVTKWTKDSQLKPIVKKGTSKAFTEAFDAIIKVETSKIGNDQ